MFDFCFSSNRPQSPCCFKERGTGCASLVMLLACTSAAHYKKYFKCPRQLHLIKLAANHSAVKRLNLFHLRAKSQDGIGVPKIKWIGLSFCVCLFEVVRHDSTFLVFKKEEEPTPDLNGRTFDSSLAFPVLAVANIGFCALLDAGSRVVCPRNRNRPQNICYCFFLDLRPEIVERI